MRARSAVPALAGATALAFLARRLRAARGEHAELHYEDGSAVTLPAASVGGARLVELARETVASSAP